MIAVLKSLVYSRRVSTTAKVRAACGKVDTNIEFLFSFLNLNLVFHCFLFKKLIFAVYLTLRLSYTYLFLFLSVF